MSSITKLQIRGIRSYSPDRDEIIEFYTPLTMIIGKLVALVKKMKKLVLYIAMNFFYLAIFFIIELNIIKWNRI